MLILIINIIRYNPSFLRSWHPCLSPFITPFSLVTFTCHFKIQIASILFLFFFFLFLINSVRNFAFVTEVMETKQKSNCRNIIIRRWNKLRPISVSHSVITRLHGLNIFDTCWLHGLPCWPYPLERVRNTELSCENGKIYGKKNNAEKEVKLWWFVEHGGGGWSISLGRCGHW